MGVGCVTIVQLLICPQFHAHPMTRHGCHGGGVLETTRWYLGSLVPYTCFQFQVEGAEGAPSNGSGTRIPDFVAAEREGGHDARLVGQGGRQWSDTGIRQSIVYVGRQDTRGRRLLWRT